MEYIWWETCLIILTKGLSWSMVIFSIFYAASWLITDLTKEIVEKKLTNRPSEE